MKRVLIGRFGAIATLGLREVLGETCVIVGEGTNVDDMMERVQTMHPDVVVFDSDATPGRSLADYLATSSPGVTVIGCSLSNPTLEVFSGAGTSYTAELSPISLLEAVNR